MSRIRGMHPSIALLTAFPLMLTACGGDAGDVPAEQVAYELKVGNLVPFTGDLAPFGRAGDRAAKLATELINESLGRIGAAGRIKVRVVASEDTQTNQTAAVEAATKLVTTNGAQVLMGAFASNTTIPVAQSVSVPNRVVQISPSSTSPDITGLADDGYLWRTAPSDLLQGRALTKAVAEAFGSDATISTGARNDAYGTALVKAFEREWKAKGGKIAQSVQWNPNAPTFDSEAGRLLQGRPDGWVIIDFPQTWVKMGPALVRAGAWDPKKTFVTDGLRDTGLPESAGSRATAGLRGTAPTSVGSPSGAAFAKLWKDRVDISRQTYDAHSFDAVMVAFLASVAAGSAEPEEIKEELPEVSGPGGTKYTFEQLDQAVRDLLDGQDVDYEGASGPIDFDGNGDPGAASYEVWQFEDGKLETLRTFPIAEE